MPADSVAAFLKAAIDNQKWVWEYAALTGYVVGGWLAGLVLLVVLGKILSALTLRSVAHGAAEVASGFDRALRFVYRGVIGLAGVYYYLSLPIVLIVAIAVPLSLGYAALMLPYVNLGLIIIVFVVGSCGVLTALRRHPHRLRPRQGVQLRATLHAERGARALDRCQGRRQEGRHPPRR